jgi:hypothetical protein
MEKSKYNNKGTTLVFSVICILILMTDCKKTENPINFPMGTFPDTILNLADINSEFDDFNVSLYELNGSAPILFSSNRSSSGGQFDLEQGGIFFTFDQTNGEFFLNLK